MKEEEIQGTFCEKSYFKARKAVIMSMSDLRFQISDLNYICCHAASWNLPYFVNTWRRRRRRGINLHNSLRFLGIYCIEPDTSSLHQFFIAAGQHASL